MRVLGLFLVALALAPLARAEEREVTDCEICGGKVYQTPKKYRTGNTEYIYIDEPPYKPYCIRCQRDVNQGKIDPSNPPAIGPRDDEEMGDNPYGNKWAADHTDVGKRKRTDKDAATKDAEGGFGAIGWVIGILVVVGLAVKFFLK